MNPNLCKVALRPRNPMEVFDLCLRLVRERSRPLLWLTLMTVLPAYLLCLGVGWLVGFEPLSVVPALLLGAWIQAPFTLLGGRLLFVDEATARDAFVGAVRAFPKVLVTVATDYFSAILICTGVGVLALPVLAYLPETTLLERVSLSRGLGRSSRLAMGQIGVACVAAGARWLLLAWGAIVGELTGQIVVGFVLQLGEPFGSLLNGDVTPYLLLGLLLTHPLYAVYRLLLYVDVRTRMEGWDLQVGLRALGLRDSQ